MKARLLVAAALLAGCHRPSPDLTVCIPPGTVAVAGIDLREAKNSPLLGRLRDRVPGLASATLALAAWDGAELMVAAAGDFPAPPAGATMASPVVALFGSEAKVKAALSQYRGGAAATPQLLSQAPRDRTVWAAIRGDATLPLRGNAANFNRLLHSTEYTSIGVTLSQGIRLEAVGTCRSAEDAARLRETTGGMLLLFGAQNPQVEQHDRRVTVTVTLPESAAAGILDSLIR